MQVFTIRLCPPHINSSSSCHITQNGSSSFLLPSSTQAVSQTSLTPNISRSNIGVSVPASPSISSSIAPTRSKTQNIGDTREYDAYHRLIITPDEDGLDFTGAWTNGVRDSLLQRLVPHYLLILHQYGQMWLEV
ncbi:hypothetical protein R3W88_014637 [Solanum pinnatisectum]|uniref:Uncharacterized protein n=1 Tax=Solanum pinnatisectum TaxID=50273 RepID=A0AAV9KUN4_9SOLN|nr:hypothetical protein R3W88_014637 [Solanum pinnatisectum]